VAGAAATFASLDALGARVVRYRGILVSIGVMALPLVIILPLPSALLDLLLSLNLLLAAIILLTTLYATSPHKFSVFPSLLLITTLYRLVLNVAATRLILSEAGEKGEHAAGEVVYAFGNFVAGDSEVVGLVIFAILVIVQFVVITKGATRIAEVAARFTLDGMPGKQMAIDADLNAGLITEGQARERRAAISREADFYGAMDGASKFVRGDAVAGILITLINIVGGLIIGVWKYGMSIESAMEVFTKLTIGDGLASQIPAFLISVAAGLIVTRSTAESNLGEDLVTQVFREPRALLVAGGFMGLMVFARMNVVVSLVLAVCCGALAYLIQQGRKAAVVRTHDEERKQAAKSPPKVELLLHVDPMELEVGYGLIRLVDVSQGGDLLDRIQMIRRQTALDLGVVIPPIRIRDNMQLDPNAYVLKIKGTKVSAGTAYADHFLAMDAGAARGQVEGIPTKEPAFGLPATWVSELQKSRAEAMGYTVVDATSVLATHLTEIIKNHAHELLTRQEVSNLVDNLKQRSPRLVEEVLNKDVLGAAELQKVLQNLLRERISIRDLESILETLGDYAPRTKIKDPDTLTEYVRHAMARTICRQFQEEDGKIYAVTLDPKVEEMIQAATEHSDRGTFLTLPPRTVTRLMTAVSREVGRLVAAGHPAVLLCSPALRPQVRRACEISGFQVAVLAYNEVAQTPVESMGQVSLAETPAPSGAPS
jgi:flagellar biosynthesis protein FlhA